MLLLDRHTVPRSAPPDQRLDRYLTGVWAALPSRKAVQKALKRGAVRRGDRVFTSVHRVLPGETFELWAADERPGVRDYLHRHVVVYEDDHIAVLHKPAGWPTSGNLFRTVENCLRHTLIPSPLPDGLQWPRPVHRLDAPTSGLLVIAKTRSAHAALGAAFADRRVQKHYHAICVGYLPDAGGIDRPLDGKSARTEYDTEQRVRSLRNDYLSLTRIALLTGRTHQIRRHFVGMGYPLFGDQRYGPPGEVYRGKGLLLAATSLRFPHPDTGAPVQLTLPVPPKFGSLLRREARRYARYYGEV